jgi:hypothetical protein
VSAIAQSVERPKWAGGDSWTSQARSGLLPVDSNLGREGVKQLSIDRYVTETEGARHLTFDAESNSFGKRRANYSAPVRFLLQRANARRARASPLSRAAPSAYGQVTGVVMFTTE